MLPVELEQDHDAPGRRAEVWKDKDHSVTELSVFVTNDYENECQETLLVVETNSRSSRRLQTQDNRQLAISVHDYLRELIDETVGERESSEIVREILHHWTVAKSLCLDFV